MKTIYNILTTTTYPLWLFGLSLLISFIMFLFFYLKQKKAWKDELVKQQKESDIICHKMEISAEERIQKIQNQSSAEIARIHAEAAESLSREQVHFAKALQQERESILQDKQLLLEMCEKELLVSIMQALASNASRLDRLEHSMSDANAAVHLQHENTAQLSTQLHSLFSQHSVPLDKVQDIVASLNKCYDLLVSITNQNEELRGLDQTITLTEINENIDSTKRDISDEIDDIKRTINQIEWQVHQLS